MPIVPKEIILPEHNSSRLIFIDWNDIGNESQLYIENTTFDDDSDALYADYCNCKVETTENPWLLGRLTSNIWLVEDSGVYDSNHEHTAKIYYIDSNTNEEIIIYKVKRAMELGQECDRLYTDTGGGLKMKFINDNTNILNTKLFIKYERFLAGTNEKITLTNSGVYAIEFFKRYGDIYGVTNLAVIKNQLLVTKDETDEYGNPIPMENIEYCDLTIENVSMDFSCISIDYSLSDNNTNKPKIGFIGVETGTDIDPTTGQLIGEKKFISRSLANKCFEASYFIVQPPKDRSWICYRLVIYSKFGFHYNDRKMPDEDNTDCGILCVKDGSLNGYNGIYDETTDMYNYEISIDTSLTSKPTFHLELPFLYTDFASISYKNRNGQNCNYDGESLYSIYNELDGLYYRIYSFPSSSQIYKIILKYRAS